MKVTMNLPQEYVDKLKMEASATGLKMSDIVRRGIDAYLKNKEQKP